MFTIPNPVLEVSLQVQEEKWTEDFLWVKMEESLFFSKICQLKNYQIQDFRNVSDFVTKVEKAGKNFGKGGSIDTAKVRNRLITDWFTGKLNKLSEKSLWFEVLFSINIKIIFFWKS